MYFRLVQAERLTIIPIDFPARAVKKYRGLYLKENLVYCSVRIRNMCYVSKVHWVNMIKARLCDAQYTQQSRAITQFVCCSCDFPKHLPWLNYQLWLPLHFTLCPNTLAVFTSGVIILPFIAAKKATSTSFCRNKVSLQCLKLRVQSNAFFTHL